MKRLRVWTALSALFTRATAFNMNRATAFNMNRATAFNMNRATAFNMNLAMVLVTLLAILPVAGCKGETKFKDSPETRAALDKCRNKTTEKDKLITQLESQVAGLQSKGSGEEIMVTLDGEIVVTAKGTRRNSGHSKVEVSAETTKAAVSRVMKSRGAIRKCYQNAIKKDSSLQARTIKVMLTVRYGSNGKVSKISLNKRISETFSACLRSVSKNWKIPPPPKAFPFNFPLVLESQ